MFVCLFVCLFACLFCVSVVDRTPLFVPLMQGDGKSDAPAIMCKDLRAFYNLNVSGTYFVQPKSSTAGGKGGTKWQL